VDTSVAYGGSSSAYGTKKDPMDGKKIGGVNVFGGGLGLYNKDKVLVGGVGVSGDSSCADHNIAWRVRHTLKLDYVPDGVCPSATDNAAKCAGPDGIVYDIGTSSPSGWGHPECSADATTIAGELPATRS